MNTPATALPRFQYSMIPGDHFIEMHALTALTEHYFMMGIEVQLFSSKSFP